MEPIKFYVVQHEGNALVFDEPTLAIAGLTSEESLRDAFGEAGAWRRVWLKKVFGKEKTEITRLCQVPDALIGFRFDPTREPAAKIAAIVERWEGFDCEPDMDAYGKLDGPVLDYLESVIEAHLHPNPVAHPGFLKAFSQKSKEKPSESA